MPGHIQATRAQTRHFEIQHNGGVRRSTMRWRDDLQCDATDSAYAQMLAHPEIGRPMSTRDSAPTKVDTPVDVKSVLNGAAKALSMHAATLPTTRDGLAPTPKQIEEDRLGPFLVGVMPVLEFSAGVFGRLRRSARDRPPSRQLPRNPPASSTPNHANAARRRVLAQQRRKPPP